MIKKCVFSAILALLSGFSFLIFHNGSAYTKLVNPLSNNSKLNVSENIWLPQVVDKAYADSSAPDLTAKAAFFADTGTGQVLYQKNIHDHLPIASLTKIMTAIVALQNKNFNDTYTVPREATSAPPDSMQLIAGEKLSLEELLDGVFLVSANDAAETIAEGTTGNRDEFIKLMNSEAKSLGMNDTLFINPTGLEEDDPSAPPDSGVEIPQYSSAYDVALMAHFAIKNWPHLVDISSQPEIDLPQTDTHQGYDLLNGINLITTYPGVVGFKIGYTPDAGLTIATLARRSGHEILGVMLDSEDRRDEMRQMLDYSFKKLGVD